MIQIHLKFRTTILCNLRSIFWNMRQIHFGILDKYIFKCKKYFWNSTQLLSHVNGLSIPYQMYFESLQVKSNTMITLFCLRTSARQHEKSAFSSLCKLLIWWEQWNKYSWLPGFWILICSKYISKCKEMSDPFHDAFFVI